MILRTPLSVSVLLVRFLLQLCASRTCQKTPHVLSAKNEKPQVAGDCPLRVEKLESMRFT